MAHQLGEAGAGTASVDGVLDERHRRQQCLDPFDSPVFELRHFDASRFQPVHDEQPRAGLSGHDADAVTQLGRQATLREHGSGLSERLRRIHHDRARLLQGRHGALVRAHQVAGVRHGELADVRTPRDQCNDRLARRDLTQRLEQISAVGNAFEVQRDRPRVRIVGQHRQHVRAVHVDRIAEAHRQRKSFTEPLDQEADAEVDAARLRDNRDAAFRQPIDARNETRDTVVVWVDEARRVRPEQPQPGAAADARQLFLQRRTRFARFAEAARDDEDPAHTARGGIGGGLHAVLCRNGEHGEVDRLGQRREIRIARKALDLLLARMHRHQCSGKTAQRPQCLRACLRRVRRSADNGDRARAQQPAQVRATRLFECSCRSEVGIGHGRCPWVCRCGRCLVGQLLGEEA